MPIKSWKSSDDLVNLLKSRKLKMNESHVHNT